jgi:hypothetical protein
MAVTIRLRAGTCQAAGRFIEASAGITARALLRVTEF